MSRKNRHKHFAPSPVKADVGGPVQVRVTATNFCAHRKDALCDACVALLQAPLAGRTTVGIGHAALPPDNAPAAPPPAEGAARREWARNPASEQKLGVPWYLQIATPAYGGMFQWNYMQGMFNTVRSLDRSGIPFWWDPLSNESLITRARNCLAARFLANPKATHLLFIDADVGFKPEDIAALIHGDFDVVCGCYPMKSFGWDSIREAARRGVPANELQLHGALHAVNPIAESDGSFETLKKNGYEYFEVVHGATGFMLIKREALLKYIAAYGEKIAYRPNYLNAGAGEVHHDIFGVGVDHETNTYLSEDYWFSKQWRAIGGKVYACLDCKLNHSGFHTWQGDIRALVRPEGQDQALPTLIAQPPVKLAPVLDAIELVSPP